MCVCACVCVCMYECMYVCICIHVSCVSLLPDGSLPSLPPTEPPETKEDDDLDVSKIFPHDVHWSPDKSQTPCPSITLPLKPLKQRVMKKFSFSFVKPNPKREEDVEVICIDSDDDLGNTSVKKEQDHEVIVIDYDADDEQSTSTSQENITNPAWKEDIQNVCQVIMSSSDDDDFEPPTKKMPVTLEKLFTSSDSIIQSNESTKSHLQCDLHFINTAEIKTTAGSFIFGCHQQGLIQMSEIETTTARSYVFQ